MKKSFTILLFFLFLFPTALLAESTLPVGVARFKVNGPSNAQYLGGAVQDALVGALIQQGYEARAIDKELDPDRLKSTKQGGKLLGLLVTGRVSVVGQHYRVLLKWIDAQGKIKQEYLQVTEVGQLLPQLESFAVRELKPPEQVLRQKQQKQESKTTWNREIVPPPPPPPTTISTPAPPPVPAKQPEVSPVPVGRQAPPPAPEPVVLKQEKKQKKAKAAKPWQTQNLRDYNFVSKRLPFQIRGLAYGDVNGDGQKEVVLTSQRKLYIYSFREGQLELMAEYPGASLDYFVEVDLLKRPGQSPFLMLTNLRGDQVSSKILQYSNGAITPVVQQIPYQLRVVSYQGKQELVGSPYTASSNVSPHNVFLLDWKDGRVRSVKKLKLPRGTNLYNYDWVQGPVGGQTGVVNLSPQGKLRFYQKKDGKYRKAWTGRGRYGGSGNYVPVEVKNFFNEVVGDYYSVPVGVQAISQGGSPQIIVVKNNSLVKNVIGRVPIIADGQIFRLTYDEMGFVEAWASKKVDGSIQDYLVTTTGDQTQLMVALRLRDPGLLGEIDRNDSVLLIYNLN